MITVNNVFFLFRKFSVHFRHFWVFVLRHRGWSKAKKLPKNLVLMFKGVNTFDAIWNNFNSLYMFIEAWHGYYIIAQS